MSQNLAERIQTSDPFKHLVANLKARKQATAMSVRGSLKSILVALLSRVLDKNVFYICHDIEQAEAIRDDLTSLESSERVAYFPSLGIKAFSENTVSPNFLSARLEMVERLLQKTERSFFITIAEALLEHLPDKQSFDARKIEFVPGKEIQFEQCIQTLVQMDFSREHLVDRPGDLSVRGGIIDIYPYSRPRPVRIEFFGDVVESIREFDTDTQRSIREIKNVTIYPQNISTGEKKYNFISKATLLDYVSEDSILVLDEYEAIESSLDQMMTPDDELPELGTIDHFESIRAPSNPDWQRLLSQFEHFHLLRFSSFSSAEHKVDFASGTIEGYQGNIAGFRERLLQLLEKDPSTAVFYLCDSEPQEKRMRELFFDENLVFPHFYLQALNLGSGFHFPAAGLHLYTNHEFFGRKRSRRSRKLLDYKISLRQLNALQTGDYVVHVDFGIGIYRGLTHITVNRADRECLSIEYRDNDRLYVPIERMDRVQKYASREGFIPPLTKLGSIQWEKLKSQARKRVQDIAEELIRVYAIRKSTPGYAFPVDTQWQKELEASFLYDDTPDQARATEDVKGDMETARPMDRLVCGDVGFGKTEIAVRAAFKAAQNSKQVAILVPTTVLAQQHYNTFRERLEKFPVQIEMLSRFRSPAQQREILSKLKNGQIDIIIGTHRLLSGDVGFSDLGLLIVDEEQRFGVLHKEKIKHLKATVDVLTLTATPIPRTMHMALMGARDLSLINTPPQDRQPIVTEVAQFDPDLIREAMLREVERGGQVYFVHNRVQTIVGMKQFLQNLLPDLKIAIAHGQMPSKNLEKVMVDFMNGQYHCLVSSMIIENGLDIPKVNTLIVNRADRFGLSQLYQLRGRVGRSNQRAFAYLLVPPFSRLKRDALKRLQTIQEFTHLGSGYQIAMRDLEIRGAGNLLGHQQSGFIDSLGFDLYLKIANEAVSELKEKQDPLAAKKQPQIQDVKLEVAMDAYLPDSYVKIESERIEIYRRLLESKALEQIHDIEAELKDRFGRLPPPAKNLFLFIMIKRLAEILFLKQVRILDSQVEGYFEMPALPENESFKNWITRLLDKSDRQIHFFSTQDLAIRAKLDKKNLLEDTKKFLQSLI